MAIIPMKVGIVLRWPKIIVVYCGANRTILKHKIMI